MQQNVQRRRQCMRLNKHDVREAALQHNTESTEAYVSFRPMQTMRITESVCPLPCMPLA